MARSDFPVAMPLLLEEKCDLLGGPFFIMKCVEGELLLKRMVRQPWNVFTFPWPLASMHLRLHSMPIEGFPGPAGDFLCRHDEQMHELIRIHGMTGLRSGSEWLRARQPAETLNPRIVHLDYHPANVVRTSAGDLVVLDWTEADLGDPHADVANSLMMMDCMPGARDSAYARLAVSAGRTWFRRWYLRSYRWRTRLEPCKLAYYRAWAALRRLCAYGRWLSVGPSATGSKPTSIGYLTSAHIRVLEQYFRKWSGVGVRLG